MWPTCQSQDQNPQNALERPSPCFLKGKDIVVASSSVFNIGVELKGMLDIQGYQYINPQISLFSDPNMQRLLFCPIFIPIILKLFLFHPFPTRVAQFLHFCQAVVDGPASILPKVGRDSAVPLAETSETPRLSGERMESETVLTVMIHDRNIYDECHWILGLFWLYSWCRVIYIIDLEFIHLPHSRCVDLRPAGGQKDGPWC